MRKLSFILAAVILLSLGGCAIPAETPQIIATTKPVYDFTSYLCADTGLTVGLLINDSVSCLHDYSLSVSQVKNAEAAELIVLSGAGLEDFMSDLLDKHNQVIDSSVGIALPECTVEHDQDHDHHHEIDPHIWLAPKNAKLMAKSICDGLCTAYPEHSATFKKNLVALEAELDALQAYGKDTLSSLSCRKLITFHDGFGYFAQAFDLTIAAAVEEESGSEASAKELIRLIELIQTENIPAVFTEINGSVSAAQIISAEIGVGTFTLDMCMSGNDYFTAMYNNILAVKEALG